jgi:hypothetical protein
MYFICNRYQGIFSRGKMEHQVDHSLSSDVEVKPLSTNILSGTLSTTLPKQPYSASETFWSLSSGCANTSSFLSPDGSHYLFYDLPLTTGCLLFVRVSWVRSKTGVSLLHFSLNVNARAGRLFLMKGVQLHWECMELYLHCCICSGNMFFIHMSWHNIVILKGPSLLLCNKL